MLSNLPSLKGKTRSAKRLGRGYGSGRGGHTVGRGTKGQKSRGRSKVKAWFEGGQYPLTKKAPKIGGFTNPTHKRPAVVNLRDLSSLKGGSVKKITPQYLVEAGIIGKIPLDGVKILGTGEIDFKAQFSGFAYSKTAQAKIETAGGQVG